MRLFQIAEKVIPSWFKFTVTTLDPVNQPLSPINLLELKWHLSWIAAMQSGEEDEESEGEDENSDLYYDYDGYSSQGTETI